MNHKSNTILGGLGHVIEPPSCPHGDDAGRVSKHHFRNKDNQHDHQQEQEPKL